MATRATAPGKIILCGEHAVVYGYPAVAVPVMQVEAEATVEAYDGEHTKLVLNDEGVIVKPFTDDEEHLHPLSQAVHVVADHLTCDIPPVTITLSSNIPIASGLGSGAATSAAIIRALLQFMEHDASDRLVSRLTFGVEKQFHGTPSGIDNTVVSFRQPVYFVRKQPENVVETFAIAEPVQLLVADTGLRSETKAVVADVRKVWQSSVGRYEAMFERCGMMAEGARQALATGNKQRLGLLMQENQAILQEIGVSSAEIDTLTSAAVKAGALGAKLSGAGRGGNVIALVTEETLPPVTAALINAGATSVLTTTLEPEDIVNGDLLKSDPPLTGSFDN